MSPIKIHTYIYISPHISISTHRKHMLSGKLNASSIPSTTHIRGPRSAFFQPSSPKPSQPARFRNERHRNGQVPTPRSMQSCHSLNTTPPQRGHHTLTRPSHGGYGPWHSPSDGAPPDKDEMLFPLHEREETKTILAALLKRTPQGIPGQAPRQVTGWGDPLEVGFTGPCFHRYHGDTARHRA